jgi:hypothetical protein
LLASLLWTIHSRKRGACTSLGTILCARPDPSASHLDAAGTVGRCGIIPIVLTAKVETARTSHALRQGDARHLDWIPDESLHLLVTSPPYWTLKEYPDHADQLGLVENYDQFHDELEKVWKHCYRALVPGGRIACVVGDVCIARRRNKGRHMVMPLHADILPPVPSYRPVAQLDRAQPSEGWNLSSTGKVLACLAR